VEDQNKNLGDLGAQLDEWLRAQNDFVNADQFAGILRTLLKLAQDNAERGDLKILNRTLQELRRAFKIFAPYRHIRKVSIFGSTRVPKGDPYYDLARGVGCALAEAGIMVITGAGPGIMQAGHEGAGRENSFGVNIRLPSVQDANPFIRDDPKLMNFHFFFTRKLMFVKEADAVIIFPGGFGTHDELLESITLAQTACRSENCPSASRPSKSALFCGPPIKPISSEANRDWPNAPPRAGSLTLIFESSSTTLISKAAPLSPRFLPFVRSKPPSDLKASAPSASLNAPITRSVNSQTGICGGGPPIITNSGASVLRIVGSAAISKRDRLMALFAAYSATTASRAVKALANSAAFSSCTSDNMTVRMVSELSTRISATPRR